MRRSVWFGLAGALALLAIGAGAYWQRTRSVTASKPAAASRASPAAASKAALSNSAAATRPKAAQSASSPSPATAPSFDIVKVSPNGEAVIAGHASPGAAVSVIEKGKTIGTVTADRRGEFVVVPEHPLAPGGGSLSLEAVDPRTGAKIASKRTVTIAGAPAAKVASAVASGKAPTPVGQPSAGAAQGSTTGAVANTAAAHATTPAGAASLARAAAEAPGGPAGTRRDARYRVKRGNNLWEIARHTYGEGIRYRVIYSANSSQIHDPDLIYPGQVFKLPRH